MSKLTDFTSYADAQREFAPARLWDLFDGDRERLNIAHECIDRHAGAEHPALIVAHADGADEVLGFDLLAATSSRFAHWLESRGVPGRRPGRRDARPGRRVLCRRSSARSSEARSRCRCSRCSGRDGVRLRVQDCAPQLLITNAEKAQMLAGEASRTRVVVADADFMRALEAFPARFEPTTRADDLRDLPVHLGHDARTARRGQAHAPRARHADARRALRHGPAARATASSAPRRRPGDTACGTARSRRSRSASPSARISGKFNAERLLRALQDHAFTNLSAAATHYRMMRTSGVAPNYSYVLRQALVHRRADRQRDRELRRSRPSAARPAACTARPRSA